jgi:hypothetical protein
MCHSFHPRTGFPKHKNLSAIAIVDVQWTILWASKDRNQKCGQTGKRDLRAKAIYVSFPVP